MLAGRVYTSASAPNTSVPTQRKTMFSHNPIGRPSSQKMGAQSPKVCEAYADGFASPQRFTCRLRPADTAPTSQPTSDSTHSLTTVEHSIQSSPRAQVSIPAGWYRSLAERLRRQLAVLVAVDPQVCGSNPLLLSVQNILRSFDPSNQSVPCGKCVVGSARRSVNHA